MLLAQITAEAGTCTQVLEVEMGEDLKVTLTDDETNTKKGSVSEHLFLIPWWLSPLPFPPRKKQWRFLIELSMMLLDGAECVEPAGLLWNVRERPTAFLHPGLLGGCVCVCV